MELLVATSRKFILMSAKATDQEPHSASIFSLIYNTTSSLLNQIVNVETPAKDDELPPESQTMKTPAAESPSLAESASKSIFSAKDLAELDFLEDISQETTQQQPSVYIPKNDKKKIVYSDPLMDRSHLLMLKKHLPLLVRESSDLVLLFSIERNGISLRTLYSRTENAGPCLIVIRDTAGHTFGAFVNESLHNNPHFYGNGETFGFINLDFCFVL
jgi:hypothetical protein